ncbi:MAG TPA: cation:proton antiporter, partial [Candidatus Limnocylindrales bacterium]
FRDVFAVLFFVAIGTLVDPSRLGAALPAVGLLLALIVVAKVAVAWLLVRIAGLEVRPFQLAIGLGQIGEFSFVLASAAVAADAIDQVLYVAIITSVAVSIGVSSVAVRLVPRPEGTTPAEAAPAA